MRSFVLEEIDFEVGVLDDRQIHAHLAGFKIDFPQKEDLYENHATLFGNSIPWGISS